MLILKTADARCVRRDRRGNTWLHFPCPHCVKRGAGPDRSAHLGVCVPPQGTAEGRHARARCFRCGAAGPLRTLGLGLDQPPLPYPGPSVSRAVVAGRTPPQSLLSLSPSSLLAQGLEQKRRLLGIWKGLTWAELAQAGVQYSVERPETFVLPYRSQDLRSEDEGVQLRQLGREPKILTFGPRGPGFIPGRLPDQDTDVVVVEGWADACAVPFPFVGLFLQGVEWATSVNFTAFPHRRVYVATDPDSAGRRAARQLLRRCLAERREARLVYLTADDPANTGAAALGLKLAEARPVETLEDLTVLSPAL